MTDPLTDEALADLLAKAGAYNPPPGLGGHEWKPRMDVQASTVATLVREVQAARAAISAFKALEWQRTDWQGFCPFRRHMDVVCLGTDGHTSPVGPPHPRPHSDACPYSLLTKMEAK